MDPRIINVSNALKIFDYDNKNIIFLRKGYSISVQND